MRLMGTVTVVLVMALVAQPAHGETFWFANADQDSIYIGDSVLFTLRTHIPGMGGQYINIRVSNDTDWTVLRDFFQLDTDGVGTYLWKTSLSLRAGVYKVEFSAHQAAIDVLHVELIFDEVDYLGKLLVLQDEKIDRLEDKIDRARDVANIAYNAADHFISRAGWLFFTITLVALYVIVKTGPRYVVESLTYGNLKDSGWDKVFGLHRVWSAQVGGDLTKIMGHEDMITRELEGDYCEECKVWMMHPEHHKCGGKVRPRRRGQAGGEAG